ncbi:MAG: class I SAM-dependent methyltransferase [Actinobacteria bacterium]|nr:MAG: class I SAM-dependent methyltransferase [Actinomycetota bacterium]TMM27145.1 MAG: class I SAM-dependent methyltransferase [Actinomycetota bacterium]
MRAYYERRAAEYDDWWLGTGLLANRHRPGWHEEAAALTRTLEALPRARTLDVACGTGFLTQHLPGEITGLDQSASMLELARAKVPDGRFLQADALELAFADNAFERLFTSFFYGHLEEDDRVTFLSEASRVAGELIVVDSALHAEVEPVEWQERVLNDGSRWQVYKRFFEPDRLAEELGGRVLFAGRWFVAVQA